MFLRLSCKICCDYDGYVGRSKLWCSHKAAHCLGREERSCPSIVRTEVSPEGGIQLHCVVEALELPSGNDNLAVLNRNQRPLLKSADAAGNSLMLVLNLVPASFAWSDAL